MRLIDEIHLKYPFMGSRSIRNQLRDLGHDVGRGHVSTLMKKMGIEALYQKPRLSIPHPGHKVYPYLLRGWRSARQSLLGSRHNLSADGQRLLLPCGSYGLGKPEGVGVEAIKYPGCLILH